MDLGQATLLVVAVYGVVELGKALLGAPLNTNPRVLVLLVLAVSFAMTFLVAATAWADEQVIGEVPMDEMGIASLCLVSFLVAGAQTLVSTGVGAVRNFGRGDPPKAAPPAPIPPGTTYVPTTEG
jgi:hypothetical protein